MKNSLNIIIKDYFQNNNKIIKTKNWKNNKFWKSNFFFVCIFKRLLAITNSKKKKKKKKKKNDLLMKAFNSLFNFIIKWISYFHI